MRQSKLLTILIYITAFILIGAFATGLYISNEIKNKTEAIGIVGYEDSKYHVMMLLNASDQAYSDAFKQGVHEASNELQISVEMIMIEDEDYLSAVLDRLDMAMYAKVDGIILHAYEDSSIVDKINQATEMDIPVITLNENIHQSKRLAYVGNSRYSVGIDVGKTIAELTNNKANFAVIDQINYGEHKGSMDLLELGIRNVFENNDDLNLVTTRYARQGLLSAETVAIEILEDFPNIDGIYCTDGQSTLGIVQVLIDQNRVNDIIVVGSGALDEILNYIGTGNVIEATVVTDYYSVGRSAIQTFSDYMENGIVNTQIIPPLHVLTEENIDAYLKTLEATDEEAE